MYLSNPHYSFRPQKPLRVPGISALLEKGSGFINEDELLITKQTYGVFDGATSLVPATFSCGRTGGRIAAEICKQVFREEDESLKLAAVKANNEIRRQSLVAGVDFRCKEELWSCSAAVIRLHGGYFEWVQLGDCQLLVIRKDGSNQLLGRIPGQDIETLRQWQQQGGLTNGTVMEVMAEEILAVRRRMNIDYGVFNGEPEALDFLATGRMALTDISAVVLFSDGLQLPQKNPGGPPDIDLFVSLYHRGGLEQVREYVRARQLEDICCTTYPRFKPHDDISGIAISYAAI